MITINNDFYYLIIITNIQLFFYNLKIIIATNKVCDNILVLSPRQRQYFFSNKFFNGKRFCHFFCC